MFKPLVRNTVLVACAAAAIWAWHRQSVIDRGERAFKRYGCADCHRSGGGPKLANVSSKYDAETLVRFIHDPDTVYRERGRKPLNPGYSTMHRVRADNADIRAIAAYISEFQP